MNQKCEIARLYSELKKVTMQRDAMVKRCHEQIAFAKEHATVDQGWMLEREYQGMIDACEEVLAAGEAAKEMNDET